MRHFLSEKTINFSRWIILCILLLAFYFYFYFFNKYHLLYLEQTQLFRFSSGYFQPFFEKPGKLIFYIGEFLSQFFIYPIIGAGIITLLAATIYILSHYILKKTGFNALVLNVIPVILIASLQSNHQYQIGLTIGIIFALTFAFLYLLINKNTYRLIAGFIGWLLLYHLAGGFALLGALLVLLFEMFHFNTQSVVFKLLGIVILSVGFPYIAFKFIYFIPFRDAWFYPFPFCGTPKILLFGALLAYFPILLLLVLGYKKFNKKEVLTIPWNYKSIFAGIVVIISGFLFIQKYAYNSKTEILLGMDHFIQTEEWNKAIELSKTFPGTNQLILYYTNLALYKTGQLSNSMFDFPQHGIDGLRLEWKRNEVAPFFGGEIFYHLNYLNEAYRWAFESMVAKGLNPRSLKRLALTSLINSHYEVATKYLNILDQTLYYKDWAAKYKTYLLDTSKICMDEELVQKRKFLIRHDFISDALDYNLGLNKLLIEHPENRMAFEYQMAIFLLKKDIKNFAENIYHIKELGYNQIPVNYEEALLFCMVYFKKDLVPEGYTIRPATIKRENNYIAQLSKFGGNRELAAKELFNQFGNTYWYYLHFAEQTDK